ncbi:T9SS type A sorting domain-containing protein [Mucilaginibacter sp.]|uniref:T9SS type A sorting domain-containing protein n=1 Tax=Mucilaginibacter sp. TaxID=1882438 RepID=UPI0035BBB43B
MKKITSKPGFEVIFSLSLFAILCLPPIVMAQNQKDFEIKIVNGDTTINGKDIKKLSTQERADAMQELNQMGNITFRHMGKDGEADIIVRRRKELRGDNLLRDGQPAPGNQPRMNGNENPASSPYKTDFYSNNDALEANKSRIRLRRIMPGDEVRIDEPAARPSAPRQFNRDNEQPMRLRIERNVRPNNRPMRMRFNERNVQNFDFVNTDNNGISTRISFRVTDAMPENGEVTKKGLTLNDLSLSPEFSTGKTLLNFNLPAKTTASVKITDSQQKVILNDKAVAGSFSKKISLPLNGIYMLTVKQGTNSITKQIIKED